ncbi:MAG TPA: hypothetical protein VKB53_13145, partial [Gammaproteobacteria bacterium]|nr:hypothetical protein [Gammaproteobacteria bacterium]
ITALSVPMMAEPMSAADLIQLAADHGIVLTADGERVIVRPASKLTPELQAAIRGRRREILETLTSEGLPNRLADKAAISDARQGAETKISTGSAANPDIVVQIEGKPSNFSKGQRPPDRRGYPALDGSRSGVAGQ